MNNVLVLLLALCVLSTVSLGCSESSEPAKGKNSDAVILFIPRVTSNTFFESANKGVQEYSLKHGFRVEYKGSPRAVIADQISIIKEAIKDQVGAVCIFSLGATALDSVLKEALSKGIKIVTWVSDVSPDARMLMVAQGTPDQLGMMLVEMGAKSLDKRGKDPSHSIVKYAWHYSQANMADQNSWRAAGEKYIKANYPKWENVAPDNYYSAQDPEKAILIGEHILTKHPDIDLIICNDPTALPGQARALQNLDLSAKNVTITGFASPNQMRSYCKAKIVERWGLWDCRIQASLGCYLANYLASGNKLLVGDRVNVPDIATVEVMPNTVLDPNAYLANDSGVILLPNRIEFTIDNVDDYDF